MKGNKNLKHLPFLLLLFLSVVSCNKKEFTLKGTLENGANKMLYLEELTPEGPLFIDSIKLDAKGRFSYKYNIPYESFYNLHVSDIDYIVLMPQANATTEISGDYQNLSYTYSVVGTPNDEALWKLQNFSNHGIERLHEIIALDKQNRATLHGADSVAGKQVTDSLYRDAYSEQQDYIVKFITDNRGSLATLIALYKPFNNHPIIDPALNMDWYEEVLSGLEEMMPSNPHTLHFANTVAVLRHKYPQQQALDFELTSDSEEE